MSTPLRNYRNVLPYLRASGFRLKDRRNDGPKRFLLPVRRSGATCPTCRGGIQKIRVNGRGTYLLPALPEKTAIDRSASVKQCYTLFFCFWFDTSGTFLDSQAYQWRYRW
ncbi:MAG: hypothetical protein C4576_15885 [Desulfobacteraceae bacterium]|nr:MAG: hypothetical protein C4576_15885 [Desulfobacteraceae bacterium]